MSNSRVTHQGSQVWRRRYCEKCGRTFTTRENVELGFLEVLKLNGSIEPFSRSELSFTVMDACDHLPIKKSDTAALVQTIELKILKKLPQDATRVASSDIAECVSDVLKRFDPLAHLKYVGSISKAPTSKSELKLLMKDSN